MANFLQTLISLSLLIAAANKAASQSTYFNYDFTSTDIHTSLLYQGDAHFPRSESTGLRLTKTNASGYPETNSVGRVVYANAVSFSSDEGRLLDFATSVTFTITPVDDKPAEGLAFFIAPYGATIPDGSAGGNLGVFGADGSNANIIAIEFDTFFNFGIDGTSIPHVGIDIESPVSSNLTVVGNAMTGQEVTAYITYEHASKLITVSVTAGSQSFVVGHIRDLSTLLSEEAQIGISAATGGSVAIHDVSSWYFLSFADVPAAKAGGGNIRQVVG